MTEIDTGLRVALTLFGVVLALTSYGVYLSFGPPSKDLIDSFDEHED